MNKINAFPRLFETWQRWHGFGAWDKCSVFALVRASLSRDAVGGARVNVVPLQKCRGANKNFLPILQVSCIIDLLFDSIDLRINVWIKKRNRLKLGDS